MTTRDRNLLVLSLLCFGGAAIFYSWQRGATGDGQTKAFFYDLSQKKLFAAPASSIPPIKGLDNTEEDAVKAVVISTNGNPNDKSSWKIAYLEKYSPGMKQQFEIAKRQGTAPSVSRALAETQRYVKRPSDAQWYPINSAQAEKILNEWLTAGPGGSAAAVCTP